MTGKLNEHPLAELIREIVAEKLSGSLRLEYERIRTAIYFDKGALVYATSNLRAHRLAEWLRRWRVITAAQFVALPQEGKSDAETGRALVEQKVLTKEALDDLRSRLAADVLRPALLWMEGTWDFNPRVRLLEDVRVQIELQELSMEAARRLDTNLTARRFSNTNEKVQPAKEVGNAMNLLPAEAFVLSRIDTSLRLHELLAVSGLSQEETLHACYALALGGFIEREQWPRAFSPEEVTKALAAAEATAQSATQKVREPEVKKAEEVKTVEPEIDEKRELEELFERVGRATNHYQIMGVTRSADQFTLKQTYHRLARRFHPDRFHQDTELHSRVESVFAKIARAYETLRDRSSRAAYDLKLEREKDMRPLPRPEPKTEPPAQTVRQATTPPAAQSSSTPPTAAATGAQRAEDSFQRGLSGLKMGNMAVALSAFDEAVRLEPKVARYRAQYGKALAGQAQMSRKAEAEFQAAIMLEPTNIAYRIMLAKLYQNLGFIKRAQGEAERASSIDPRNAEAQALLAELQSTQGTR
jgi:curved DNA-binding protein CbpA